MTEREDPRQLRERKLRDLVALGLPCLPNRYGPTRRASDIHAAYEALDRTRVRVAGRLLRVRLMGKAAFAHILDSSGELQLYFKLDTLGTEKYEYFKLLDLGDIIGLEGTVFKTRTGEVTIQAEECILLAKAYLPLPEKWHGLTDKETRYRQRYLDLLSNEDSRRTLLARSAVVRAIRRYLDDLGFIEVETPILQPLYGGAAANPFVTHYQAIDADVYLRIATELYLKRLIVGGFERVYEIGKDFRNEGFSRKHSPEFTMIELYQAYADYRDIMALSEELVSAVAQQVTGSATVSFDEHQIDLTPPWRRLTVHQALLEYAGVDMREQSSRECLLAAVRRHNIPVEPEATRGKLLDELLSTCVEPMLIQPTIVYDYPLDFPGSLLAKRKRDEPDLTERFEIYLGGMEVANAFTELNDPADQRERMEIATTLSGQEHQEVDRDFLLALEHGMPPTGGLGIGIDRLVMVLTGAEHIRETILFPLLRQREDIAPS